MGHLRDPGLHKYHSGSTLSAEVLNHDFNALRELAEQAAGLALTPDKGAKEALRRIAAVEVHIERLEDSLREPPPREQMTPLPVFGELVKQVSALRDLFNAGELLRAEVARYRDYVRAVERRIATLAPPQKPPPPAPTMEAFEALQAELAEAKESAAAFDYQARRLRTEVAQLRADMEQRDKAVAEAQFAAHEMLLRRMLAFEESTAADEVVQMRAELAAMKRLIEDTDRKESLQRFFTPRAMTAYLMRKVAELEQRAP